jgi:thiamine pyrophosphate-dependent acetolactate synthase large subunit-like protein
VKAAVAVGAALAAQGVDTVFGVVGSGNFHVTNALVAGGARFVAARHECGAASMADAYARLSRTVGVVSVHQGPGLTNALTGITEAAKSRTPLLVLAADTAAAAVHSNFRIGQDRLAEAVGAVAERIHSAESAVTDALRAYRTAAAGNTVVLNLPLDIQAAECPPPATQPTAIPAKSPTTVSATVPAPEALRALADLVAGAERPVFIAGRGARLARAGAAIEEAADRAGALLATSAVAKGLFAGNPWALDVCGGFATPLAADLVRAADLVVGWGCALNMWTTRHGALIGSGATVVQVDQDAAAIGVHRPVHLGVVGDAEQTARALAGELAAREDAVSSSGGSRADSPGGSGGVTVGGYRTPEVRKQIAAAGRWRDVDYPDDGDEDTIDPRTLSIALDKLLPAERTISVDGGNFMGYPSMFLSVPDEDGFCFPHAYQSIGLGLACAVGTALARPDRLPVAALGDGGALMGIADLETVVRLGLPMVIIVYDDAAYSAEVHHFGPDGHPLDTVRFPRVDIAAIARGFGCAAVTVRSERDLAAVSEWVAGPRDRPLLIDAMIAASRPAWWLEEAFRGH